MGSEPTLGCHLLLLLPPFLLQCTFGSLMQLAAVEVAFDVADTVAVSLRGAATAV
jgi:hypothetical protein